MTKSDFTEKLLRKQNPNLLTNKTKKKELKMSFPIQFIKKNGDYDFLSPLINFTGNAAVVAVGGVSLGAISYLALKALGFNKTATTIATAIPVTIGAFGLVGAVGGGFVFIAIMATFLRGFSQRY